MSLDPKKLFVVSAVTREGIAADLNDYLQNCEDERRVTDDDDRLTDEVCQYYADLVSEIECGEDMTEGDKEEAFEQAFADTLAKIGIEC